MKRLAILLCLLLIGLIAVLLVQKQANDISLFEASAVQSTENGDMFVVSLRIENSGAPDRLIGVSSPTAHHVSIMNSGAKGAAIIIPENGTGLLAMDGAHIMLTVMPDTFERGGFIPLNLIFENAGAVSVRVQNAGPSMMDHGQSAGVSGSPAPELAISWKDAPEQNGAKLQLETRNFTFMRVDGMSAHVANEGHAHVYLNGLKLGRLYEDTYDLGALSPGIYTLSVALNSNDHRPYLDNGRAVKADLKFDIPE